MFRKNLWISLIILTLLISIGGLSLIFYISASAYLLRLNVTEVLNPQAWNDALIAQGNLDNQPLNFLLLLQNGQVTFPDFWNALTGDFINQGFQANTSNIAALYQYAFVYTLVALIPLVVFTIIISSYIIVKSAAAHKEFRRTFFAQNPERVLDELSVSKKYLWYNITFLLTFWIIIFNFFFILGIRRHFNILYNKIYYKWDYYQADPSDTHLTTNQYATYRPSASKTLVTRAKPLNRPYAPTSANNPRQTALARNNYPLRARNAPVSNPYPPRRNLPLTAKPTQAPQRNALPVARTKVQAPRNVTSLKASPKQGQGSTTRNYPLSTTTSQLKIPSRVNYPLNNQARRVSPNATRNYPLANSRPSQYRNPKASSSPALKRNEQQQKARPPLNRAVNYPLSYPLSFNQNKTSEIQSKNLKKQLPPNLNKTKN